MYFETVPKEVICNSFNERKVFVCVRNNRLLIPLCRKLVVGLIEEINPQVPDLLGFKKKKKILHHTNGLATSAMLK